MTDSVLRKVAADLAERGHDPDEIRRLLTPIEDHLTENPELFNSMLQRYIDRGGDDALARLQTDLRNHIEAEVKFPNDVPIDETEVVAILSERFTENEETIEATLLNQFDTARMQTGTAIASTVIGEWDSGI